MKGELGTGPSPEENILLSETKIKEHLEINHVEQIKKNYFYFYRHAVFLPEYL